MNVNHDEIERLAYRLWRERGSPPGSPGEDWFRAEQELRRTDPVVGLPLSSYALEPIEQ